MLHRTLFSHIAMSVVLFLGGISTAARAQSVLLLDIDLVANEDSIDVFVPASGMVILEAVDQRAPSEETLFWVDLVPTRGATGLAMIDTLSRRLDQQVAWVDGPATVRVLAGTIDPSLDRDRTLRVRLRWFPLAGGVQAKDGDGDDTGESDNEILPVTVPGTKDGDGDDTGESDNEILPVSVPGTKDGDGDDTGESDNEILPLTGEVVAGWLGDTREIALAAPSRLTLDVMVEGVAQVSIVDEAGRVLVTQELKDAGEARSITLVVPSGRYRVSLMGASNRGHAYALSARVEALEF